jgi:predicted CoA-binding protein
MKRRPSASSVSAFLRRQGYRPVPARDREGVHVSGGLTTVQITMQWDSERQNQRAAQDIATLLLEAGYHVIHMSPHSVTVGR